MYPLPSFDAMRKGETSGCRPPFHRPGPIGRGRLASPLAVFFAAALLTGCPTKKHGQPWWLLLLGSDSTPPTIVSTTPANTATAVSPLGATITVTFSEPMRTSELPVSVTTENYDGQYWIAVPNTAPVFTWTSSTTLTIQLSWVRFPEVTLLRWTLPNTNLHDVAGNQLASSQQQTFTTGLYSVSFPVSDTGQTLCYNASASQTCGNASWPGQDADSANTPNARSFTGPTAHSTYTSDYTTTDNVTGIVWASCASGLSGPTCGGGAPLGYNWFDAINACAAMNSANSGAGYAGRKNWRLPTAHELETLPDYSRVSPPIDVAAFPGTPISTINWTSTEYPSSNLAVYMQAYYVDFKYGSLRQYDKPAGGYVRCVALGP